MSFSAVHQFGGKDNNPSTIRFSSAFRSRLSHAVISIYDSVKANCFSRGTKIDLRNFVKGIVEYVAGWVLRNVPQYVSGEEYSLALVRSTSEWPNALLILTNSGGLVVPSVGVIKVVKRCELSCVPPLTLKRL